MINVEKETIQFIADVINAPPIELPAIQEFKRLLSSDYMEYAKNNNSLADEAGALIKLQEVSRQLELIAYDDAITKRTVIAVAGSFSSGKSSFMNSFFVSRKVKLPIGMTQTTAISSYVLPAEEPGITGCSYRGGRVEIPKEIFKQFSHDNIRELNINMKQIVRSIFFRNKFVYDFKNLCFIDTPGFNPGKDEKEDYDEAITAIAAASALIWCIDVNDGTIKSKELEILYDIYRKNDDIDVYVIINKSDQKSDEEVASVIDEVERQLHDADIPFAGISVYQSVNSYLDQPKERKNLGRGISLFNFLEEHDKENIQKEKLLLQQVQDVFKNYIDADNIRIKKHRKQIKLLDEAQQQFSSRIIKKDETIANLESQRDRRYRNSKITEDDEDDDFFVGLGKIKADFKKTIDDDESDIKEAEELSYKMQKCISTLFGHNYREIEKAVLRKSGKEESSTELLSYNKLQHKNYCNYCGTKLESEWKFCNKCGKSAFLETNGKGEFV